MKPIPSVSAVICQTLLYSWICPRTRYAVHTLNSLDDTPKRWSVMLPLKHLQLAQGANQSFTNIFRRYSEHAPRPKTFRNIMYANQISCKCVETRKSDDVYSPELSRVESSSFITLWSIGSETIYRLTKLLSFHSETLAFTTSLFSYNRASFLCQTGFWKGAEKRAYHGTDVDRYPSTDCGHHRRFVYVVHMVRPSQTCWT